jgi:hypothetical protein
VGEAVERSDASFVRFGAVVAAAAIALGAAGATAAAQRASLVDSVMKLNRAGQWEQAVNFVQASTPRAVSVEERCGLRVGAAWAQARIGSYGSARENLKQIDGECANTAAVRQMAANVKSVREEVDLPPLPTTGLDFSAVDEFWRVAATLANDAEPSDAEWRAMFRAPGYRLSTMVVPTTRSDMEIALRPSRGPEYDSLTTKDTDLANRLRHLRRAVSDRAELAHCRDSIAGALPVKEAVTLAAKFLPPRGTEAMPPPLVTFAIFRDDAYSLGPTGVAVDLDHVCVEGGLTLLLAHEFHHSYLSNLSTIARPSFDQPDAMIVNALMAARNEGIADLIDKPYPLAYPNSAIMSAYAKRYNDAYARTPAVIHSIDSALVIAADDSTKLREVGRRVQALLPSSGHYNGSYLARAIYETFGVDSLYPGVSNQFAFLRTYAAAERQRGNPPPFSAKAVELLDRLEAEYRAR